MSELKGTLGVWIQRLHAPDAAERLTSIKALAALGDTDALPALAEVFATDPEPELRALAQEAGKSIYYGAIRRSLEESNLGASEEERRRAAEILARAEQSKLRNKRQRS